MSNTYNILSLDGGGVKGIFTIQLLAKLVEQCPNLLDDVDLISGASTGAILALALAFGTEPIKVLEFYKASLPRVFKDSYWDNIVDLGNLIGAQYDYANLKSVLKGHFGYTTLGDLQKKVLIPTLDLDNESPEFRTWKPKFYNSFQAEDLSQLVVDVAIKSAAAPSYFPTYKGFVDGGLAANSPSISAVSQALDSSTGGQELSNIRVISLGTGYSPTYISGKKLDWGTSQWAKFLIPIFLDSMMFSTNYQCQKLLGNSYHRLDATYDKNIALDDIEQIDYLEETASAVDLTETLLWISEKWKK
jgi:patatin-like phospholipase/acyl hydrolase